MESLECHISSPVKTICFFKNLLTAINSSLPSRPGRMKLIGVPGSNARAAGDSPGGPAYLAQAGTVFSARAWHVGHKLTDDQSHNENRCCRQLNRSPVRIDTKLEGSLCRCPKILRAPRP